MVRSLVVNIASCLFCLLAIGAGLVWVSGFETAGADPSQSHGDWPKETPLSLDRTHLTLLMFAHPRCPCTRASLEELKAVLAIARGKVTAEVLFLSPSRKPSLWTLADRWHEATAIPGLR